MKEKKNFFDMMQALDRRWIYLIVALAIIIPLLIPFNSRTDTTEPSENVYKMIDSFSGKSNKAILLCVSHDASTMAELFPMEVSILRHCFERNIKVFSICFSPTSAPLVDYAINTAKEDFPDIKSGEDYCNFGYKSASLFLPILLGMGEDIANIVETDAEGRKIANLEIMKDIRNYDDMNLIIDFSASGSVFSWVTYARVKFGANVAAGVTAVMAADNYPYLQSGQLIGMLAGLKGAAEYEKMVDVFAVQGRNFSKEVISETRVPITGDHELYGNKIPMRFKKARIGMNAQSVAHIMMIVFIILGNIGYFVTRKKKG
jgi:hypothetical protein